MPSFSVIMPTRNRPELFRRALDSVLIQSAAVFEVIVVNDGSDPAHEAAYQAIEAEVGPRVRFLDLVRRARGHGQSYAINAGADAACNEYLCFLDDDDLWTDPRHLDRAAQAIRLADGLDLFMADQVAWRDGVALSGPIWIEDVLKHMPDPPVPDALGCHAMTPAGLLRAHGFCHLNTLTIRRALFLELGGLDENLRYECDRDFYLRALDRAQKLCYAPFPVARHHVPEAAKAANMSTMISTGEKRLCQLRLLDKLQLSARRPELRHYARLHKAYALQRLAHELAAAGSHRAAAQYARQALAVRPSARWLARTIVYGARSLVPNDLSSRHAASALP